MARTYLRFAQARQALVPLDCAGPAFDLCSNILNEQIHQLLSGYVVKGLIWTKERKICDVRKRVTTIFPCDID